METDFDRPTAKIKDLKDWCPRCKHILGDECDFTDECLRTFFGRFEAERE